MLNWIVERDRWGEDLGALLNAITSRGMDVQVVDYMPFQSGEYGDLYPSGSRVMTFGSINLVTQLMRENRWAINAYCNMDGLLCRNYYPYVSDWLLNEDYVMLPYGDLRKRKDWLFENFGTEYDHIFMRPDIGSKSFPGGTFDNQFFFSWLNGIDEHVQPHDLVVISSPKKIETEWRFFVRPGEVITGSIYKCEWQSNWTRVSETAGEEYRDHKGRSTLTYALETVLQSGEVVDTGKRAWDFTKMISEIEWPGRDPVFVVDVAQVEGGEFKLIEFNAASCSGLYACDPDKIVAAIAESAS